jgi:hypothetical protein
MRRNLRKLDGMDDLFIEYPKTVDWTLDYEIFPIVFKAFDVSWEITVDVDLPKGYSAIDGQDESINLTSGEESVLITSAEEDGLKRRRGNSIKFEVTATNSQDGNVGFEDEVENTSSTGKSKRSKSSKNKNLSGRLNGERSSEGSSSDSASSSDLF